MALDRDELAARCLVARLTDVEYASEPIDAANAAVAMADALLARLSQDRPALVPVAPATDPRRTVGAVVKGLSSEVEFIVVDSDSVRRVDHDWTGAKAVPLDCDTFVRWATREECERHGLNYVARPLPGAPLAAPSPAASPAPTVDREGLARAIYEAVRAGNMLMGAKPWESVGNLAKNDSLNAADAAIAFMAKGGA